MYYEVYIPSPDPDGFDVTITVDAENWMSALKSGLKRTGEGAEAVRNVMCDIKDDNTIHVTDATTQRVFVLEELGEEPPDDVVVGEPEEGGEPPSGEEAEEVAEAEPEEADESEPAPTPEAQEPAQEAAEESAPDLAPEPEPEPDEPESAPELAPEVDEGEAGLGEEDSFTRDESEMRVGSSTHEALKEEEQEPKVVEEQRERTDQHRAAQVGRQDEKVSESLIEDVFLEIQPIHEGDMGMEEVVNFVIDLAMDSIAAESGSVLFADTSGRELYFAAARGPKASEVMDFRVPMGEGIVGFCSKEGVSLAVSDAQNDPRFYEDISESIGYETDSLLCAPVQFQGRVYGAIELINRDGGSTFTSNEMNALSYIGRQLAEYVNRVVMSQEDIED